MAKVVISLFDESGNMGRPWAEKGCYVICVDTENYGKRPITFESGGCLLFVNLDLSQNDNLELLQKYNPDIIFGFPPCTDLAVSGSMHFEKKRALNPDFQREATELARQVEKLGNICKVPWFAENPVSVLASTWRRPDYYFHPYEYGGYLPEDDVHPRWPDYIPPRDKYRKKTALWTGNGFKMPVKKSVGDPGEDSPQHRKLGGKSAKTKQIRSETPRGFAVAVMEANYDHC